MSRRHAHNNAQPLYAHRRLYTRGVSRHKFKPAVRTSHPDTPPRTVRVVHKVAARALTASVQLQTARTDTESAGYTMLWPRHLPSKCCAAFTAKSAQACTSYVYIWSASSRDKLHPHWATNSQVWPPQGPRCFSRETPPDTDRPLLQHGRVKQNLHQAVLLPGLLLLGGNTGTRLCVALCSCIAELALLSLLSHLATKPDQFRTWSR
mmetsp:Transcript_78854/g.254730  ORF Transcript_78854/g.254730 Transcript_78854/m.254730 type:complete len:207 (+) Transcript_78854:177-797(+)